LRSFLIALALAALLVNPAAPQKSDEQPPATPDASTEAPLPKPPKPLKKTPKDPLERIRGNTLHGVEENGEFYDYFKRDGGATWLHVASKSVTEGTYTIEDDKICLDFQNDSASCFAVSGKYPKLTLTNVDNGQAFPVEVLKGNPRKLK